MIEQSKLRRLLTLAHLFHLQAEAPDEEAIDSLHFYLATQNVERLEELLRGWNIDPNNEEV